MRNNSSYQKRYISQPNNYNHQYHNTQNYTPQTNTSNIFSNTHLSHSYIQTNSQAIPYIDNQINLHNSFNYNNFG